MFVFVCTYIRTYNHIRSMYSIYAICAVFIRTCTYVHLHTHTYIRMYVHTITVFVYIHTYIRAYLAYLNNVLLNASLMIWNT